MSTSRNLKRYFVYPLFTIFVEIAISKANFVAGNFKYNICLEIFILFYSLFVINDPILYFIKSLLY